VTAAVPWLALCGRHSTQSKACRAEDLHHFDGASWRLLTAAVSDESLRSCVLYIATYRPNYGALSPALRQRAGSKELQYHRIQAAYRTLLAQVR
jgi:hypothetical protein